MTSPESELARSLGRRVWLATLLAAALAGCEGKAIELVRQVETARGDCTFEGLRTSDEECVRMMERYAGMTADLMDGYVGGVRALDVALERMPPFEFDTAGFGYAISPEFRGGDAAGEGASPRLWAGFGGKSTVHRAAGAPPAWLRPPPADAPAWLRSARRPLRNQGPWQHLPLADRFRYDIFESGPYGYFGEAPWDRAYGYGYVPDVYSNYDPYRWPAPDARYRTYKYGYGDDYPGRYGPSPYGDGYGYRLDPGRFGYRDHDYDAQQYGGYGYGYGDGYPGYDIYEHSAPGYGIPPREYAYPYGADRSGGDGTGGVPGNGVRTPADDWGYLPETENDGAALGATPEVEGPDAARRGLSRPAPHRPGILLPPEERLRRPWLED